MFHSFFHAIAFGAVTAVPAWAQDLGMPLDEVILTVFGDISATNVDDTAQFDLAMLEALDATAFETTTIWTEGVHTFAGVALNELVDRLGVKGETLLATAINDYSIEIPLEDAIEGGPIIAYRMDGETMSVRDKGPLWIVYPFDDNADYRSEVVYSRSIWQLDRIEVLD